MKISFSKWDVLTALRPIAAALRAFIAQAGRSGFDGAPRVDRLMAHPDDADPGHDHQSLALSSYVLRRDRQL
jgi:hypothetical protein